MADVAISEANAQIAEERSSQLEAPVLLNNGLLFIKA